MYRALIELLIVVLVALVARALLTSILRSIGNVSANVFRNTNMQFRSERSTDRGSETNKGRDLHKDPICGTYVAESTPFQQTVAGQVFYYCSSGCREKHSWVAR